MKPIKRSVAVVVRNAGAFLIVRRPDDPEDPLAGLWGLPAVTLLDGEDERAAVVRAGRVKLGVELAVGARLGEKTADRGGYMLRLADYEATVRQGTPAVPQRDASLTQYSACQYTTDPATLAEAASRGSLCAQVFLEDNSKRRLAAGGPLAAGGQLAAGDLDLRAVGDLPAAGELPPTRDLRATQDGA